MRFVPIALTLAVVCACAPAPVPHSADGDTVDIESRPGVTVGFVATAPAGPPRASAILFSGGNGKLRLWQGRGARSSNFLVRSRTLFAARGILTATIDVPSDRRRPGLDGFRHTEEHRADVEAVIRWLRARTTAPVWLIGTSRGTVSLSHVAAKVPVDGVVYTSSVTASSRRRPPTALDGDLESIAVPVLLVHHAADDCVVTPATGVAAIAARLRKSRKVDTRLFSGGSPPRGRACGPLSAHGFLGIEAEVVDAIVDWMTANPPR